MAFKETPVTIIALRRILMTDILLWVGFSHWFVDVIARTYDLKLLLLPLGPRAHFTRGMAASGSRFHELSLQKKLLYVQAQAELLHIHSTSDWFTCLDITMIVMVHRVLGETSL